MIYLVESKQVIEGDRPTLDYWAVSTLPLRLVRYRSCLLCDVLSAFHTYLSAVILYTC